MYFEEGFVVVAKTLRCWITATDSALAVHISREKCKTPNCTWNAISESFLWNSCLIICFILNQQWSLGSFEIIRVTGKCRTCLTLSPHTDRAGFRRGGAAAFLDRMSQSETKTGERNPVETLTCEMIYKCNLLSLMVWIKQVGRPQEAPTDLRTHKVSVEVHSWKIS